MRRSSVPGGQHVYTSDTQVGPKANVSVSAAALHLLLAQYPELADLPVEWTISLDRVIRPFITVRHPDCDNAARLIAAALELDIDAGRAFDSNGAPTRSLYVEGRWGGAQWSFVAYAAVTTVEGVS